MSQRIINSILDIGLSRQSWIQVLKTEHIYAVEISFALRQEVEVRRIEPTMKHIVSNDNVTEPTMQPI